jgi:hypothetical protein
MLSHSYPFLFPGWSMAQRIPRSYQIKLTKSLLQISLGRFDSSPKWQTFPLGQSSLANWSNNSPGIWRISFGTISFNWLVGSLGGNDHDIYLKALVRCGNEI